MADRLLEAPPRDEALIIQAALRSGLFLRDAPSTRAALVRRMEQMEDNARPRAVQERRRGMEEARRAQDDYAPAVGSAAPAHRPPADLWAPDEREAARGPKNPR